MLIRRCVYMAVGVAWVLVVPATAVGTAAVTDRVRVSSTGVQADKTFDHGSVAVSGDGRDVGRSRRVLAWAYLMKTRAGATQRATGGRDVEH